MRVAQGARLSAKASDAGSGLSTLPDKLEHVTAALQAGLHINRG